MGQMWIMISFANYIPDIIFLIKENILYNKYVNGDIICTKLQLQILFCIWKY